MASFLLLPLLGACGADIVDATAVLSPGSDRAHLADVVATVMIVSWSTNEPAVGFVEYGPDTEYGYATPVTTEEGLDHEVDVIGLPAGQTWHWRVVARTAAGDTYGPDHTITAPDAPDSLPDIELLDDDGLAWGQFTLASFAWIRPDFSGGLVLGAEGEVVWYWVDVRGRFVPYANYSTASRSALFLASSDTLDPPSSVVYVGLDGQSIEEIEVPYAHHSITEVGVAGARFAYIASVEQEIDGERVQGDRIVEVGDDGTEREVWNAFDWLPIERHEGWNMPTASGAADWTHANGLFYDEASDAYVLSLYYQEAILKIDRASGEMVWTLGGADSDFTFPDDAGFERQHAPELHGDTIWLFDNGSSGASRAVAYTLDEGAGTATRLWAWETPEAYRVGVLGDVDVLDDDQVLIAWGDLGQVGIVDRDGTVHRRVDAEPGAIVGRASRLAGLYAE